MSSVMKYKDYIGSVEFSEEDQLFYGKVLGIHSLISYEGESAKELIQDFHEAVDDYLELCVEKRIEPEKAYKGSFNVRISPDLHRSIAIHVFEYAGPEQADTMFRFCYDHGLLNEDRETEYVFRMICNLLSINESHSKYGFKLNDGEINCQSKEQAEVLSEFFEDLGFDAMPMQQNPDDTWQLYEEWKLM